MTTQHTPTRLASVKRISEAREYIGEFIHDGEFIRDAHGYLVTTADILARCNAHEELVAALRDLVQYADPLDDTCGSQIANARALLAELDEVQP